MKGGQVLGVWGQVDTGRRTSSDSKAKTPHLSVVLPRSPPQPFHLPPQTLHVPPSPPPHLRLLFLFLPRWDERVEDKADSDVTC